MRFNRSRKPAARDSGPDMIHVYWPDVGWVLEGDGRERYEYSPDEIAAFGTDEWRQVESLYRLRPTYGDGRCYIVTYGGQFFLVLNGNEYGSSAMKVPIGAVDLLRPIDA